MVDSSTIHLDTLTPIILMLTIITKATEVDTEATTTTEMAEAMLDGATLRATITSTRTLVSLLYLQRLLYDCILL